jgi:hypothetical protein
MLPPDLNQDGEGITVPMQRTSGDEASDAFNNEAARKQKLDNDSNQQDMGERIRYATQAYNITKNWVWFLIILTVAHMLLKKCGLTLDTSVFITIFTTTTASIFGFWFLVGQYLFSKKN